MRSTVLWVMLWLLGSLAYAQEAVVDKEVAREAMIIEASREKMLGRLDKAKELYKKILTEYPTSEVAAYELARILLQQNQPEEAVIWAGKASLANPSNTWYAVLKADALQAMGQYKDAAEIYAQLSKQYPTNNSYYFKWAFYLVKANEFNAALKVYDELERRKGLDENLARLKQSLYLAQGDPKKAAREWQRLAEAHPNNVDYWHNLAEFYTQIGDQEAAKSVYRKIIALDANDSKANLALAGGSVSKQNDAQYLSTLRQSIENRDVDLSLKLAKLSPVLDKYQSTPDPATGTALLTLTQILEQQYPKEAQPLAMSAMVLSTQGKKAEAVEKMRLALNLDDTQFKHWELYLHDLDVLGDMPALLKATEQALDVFPNKPELYLHAAQAEWSVGRLSNAEDFIQQALPMSAKFLEVRQQLLGLQALIRTLQGKLSEADQLFAEATKLSTGTSAAFLTWQALSQAQRSEGAATALDLAQKARQAAPQARLAIFALAKALLRNGNVAEAKKQIESLLPSAQPLYLEQYGDILFKSGDTNAAVQQWNLAVTKGSTAASLKKKINEKQLHE